MRIVPDTGELEKDRGEDPQRGFRQHAAFKYVERIEEPVQ
jgi:hypothetical protein